MPYIPFTDEDIREANAVSLEDYLPYDSLKKSGGEYRWLYRDHTGLHDSITIRGNRWYDHKHRTGGTAVSFLQEQMGMSFQEAVSALLGRHTDLPTPRPNNTPREAVQQKAADAVKFQLPEANGNMRRVYAYLIGQRHIAPEIVSYFAHRRLLYESREFLGDPPKEIHNAVFVGTDTDGVPCHAHKRSLNSYGKSHRYNVTASDADHSFCHIGTSEWMFVFEAPIDLLSYLTLHPQDWQRHSYVALCGTSEHAVLARLREYPRLREIAICLDNDVGGIDATDRLVDILWENGYTALYRRKSQYKDWNEDLKAQHGEPPKPAVPHLYKERFLENLNAYQFRSCSDLSKTRARLWALYKDVCQSSSQESLKRLADHAASDIGLIRSRIGQAASQQEGFLSFLHDYRKTYRAYRDGGNRQARENRLQQAITRAMRDLNSSAVRTPEQYEQTAEKLEAVFDSAAKLYTAVQLEQKLEPATEPEPGLQQNLG